MRFSHPGVQLIDFSPCERYLVTFSPLPDNPDDPQVLFILLFACCDLAIVIWDMRTGTKKRDLCVVISRNGQCSIFGLLEKKSLKIEGVREFAWSPTDEVIAFWVPEYKDTPALLHLWRFLAEMKSVLKICLMCLSARYTGSKKEIILGLYYNLELFRVRERQIPVDVVEMKEAVSCIFVGAWW
ncbi:translation initiation factor eIF-3b like protein [Desmophyllum pertusum]|uniref:Translation initiation factor eIF-3b like protein n=1 Tax=Desmophyllum pertusum TaxID=174260 RepID=A0A9X0CSI0_9CNID|nr:translation initiation factor eIF-3b like protein [Desmophyllum pertusum]